MKKSYTYLLAGLALLSIVSQGCEWTNEEDEETVTSVDDIVSTKYSTAINTSNQNLFGALNVHDPKLFQDDDGTYYIYSTDASCGNVEKTGISIRYSSDLVNWTCVNKSAIRGNWDEDFLAWETFTAASSDVKHSNSAYTAVSWAPTVIKQNGLYYMYHGVNADVNLTSGKTQWGSCIALAIAKSAKGPFYPADYISSYTGTDSTISSIKSTLESLGVSYKQSLLVRYTADYTASLSTASLGGESIDKADLTESDNKRYGCIDPEFVYDVATGDLMEYTIESNECYALTYGSWMNGIALTYVDKVSLKPVLTKDNNNAVKTALSLTNGVGDELDVPLDTANYYYYGKSYRGNEGCLGIRIAGGYGAGYEGAQLIYNSDTGYYYIFVSMGDLSNEYRVGVGRSKDIDGEYEDAGGQSMRLTSSNYSTYHAIGSKIIGAAAFSDEYGWRCPGGQSILCTQNGKIIFACHTRSNFMPSYYFWLQCHQMFFTDDGWPVLNQNEYYASSSFTEQLSSLSMSEIAGTYDAILTVRGSDKSSFTNYEGTTTAQYSTTDANETTSSSMIISSDGSVTGSYTGSLTLGSDGYSVVLKLDNYGTFTGYALYAIDWARKGDVERKTVKLTLIDSTTEDTSAGEYFFANNHNY